MLDEAPSSFLLSDPVEAQELTRPNHSLSSTIETRFGRVTTLGELK